jgi:peptidoglycan/xylan/chitin deacetylase (PgdA/CDA1 family)
MTAFDPDFYRQERYLGDRERSAALSLYYRVKPAIPRSVQLAMRRAFAKKQARTPFPHWPIEPILLDHAEQELRARIEASPEGAVPVLDPWPDGHRWASVLTHDVEGPLGVSKVREVMELEARHGFASSWNFVAEWYPIEDGLFDHVRAMGHEIGLHAIKHDCLLFESRENFEADLPAIHRYLAEWGAVGFRSPATHRNPDWMPELGCLYDSSFPDTDPYEPQPGGCCSILPFMLGDLVELPITLVQDHTLWEILREPGVQPWIDKGTWLMEQGGLLNVIVHPDYLDTPKRMSMYEDYLAWLAEQEGGWHALPREVAQWWKDRETLELVTDEDGTVRIVGDEAAAARATVSWAVADGDGVRLADEPAAAR